MSVEKMSEVDIVPNPSIPRRDFLKGAAVALGTLSTGGLGLAACGEQHKSVNVSKGPVTLRHWTYLDYPDDPTWNSLVQEFNATHKDIQVVSDVLPFTELRTKINTAVATGGAPDTARVITYWHGEIRQSGWAEPLDSYVNKWSGKDDLVDGLLDYGRAKKGEPLTYLPNLYAPGLIYYRKDILQQAGLGVPKTHEDLLAAIIKTNDPPNRYGWGMRGDAVGFWYWMPFLKQNGVDIVRDNGDVDLDSSVAIDTTDWYLDILRKHHASQPSGVTDGFAPIFALFQAGKLTFAQHSILLGPIAAKAPNAGAMALPKGKVREWTYNVTTGHAVFKSSKNKQAAFEWISWLNEAPQMKKWSLSPTEWTMPLNKSLLKDPAYDHEFFKAAAAQKHAWGTFPTWHPYWAQWQDQDFKPAWQAALLGKISAKDMLLKFADGFRKNK